MGTLGYLVSVLEQCNCEPLRCLFFWNKSLAHDDFAVPARMKRVDYSSRSLMLCESNERKGFSVQFPSRKKVPKKTTLSRVKVEKVGHLGPNSRNEAHRGILLLPGEVSPGQNQRRSKSEDAKLTRRSMSRKADMK